MNIMVYVLGLWIRVTVRVKVKVKVRVSVFQRFMWQKWAPKISVQYGW